jgi:hypothetical protein
VRNLVRGRTPAYVIYRHNFFRFEAARRTLIIDAVAQGSGAKWVSLRNSALEVVDGALGEISKAP